MNNIGYNNIDSGMDGNLVDIEIKIVKQSSDIASGLNQKRKKDQGDKEINPAFKCISNNRFNIIFYLGQI